ncbi:MAG: hypothetical protein CMC96_01315 [Flavobacteriales bacterium]|nr:hypothetical protein [Flavobacteriales bacterium]|tara:strand:+ start:7955 stop:9343 length:1389 start_codon:yes stop_codon:yes gene_type:complete
MKKYSFVVFLVVFSLFSKAQIKLFNNGDIAIGSITTPRQSIELMGNTLFTKSATTLTSSPLIVGENGFSDKGNPSFTFYGDDKTGIFHNAFNSLGLTVGAKSRILLNNHGSVFTDSISYLFNSGSAAMIRSVHEYSSASSPDYSWFNNDNTGIYHPDHNNICFSIDGVSAMCMEWAWNSGLSVNWHRTTNSGTLKLLRGDREPSASNQYMDLLYDPNLGGVINSGSDEVYFYNYETENYNSLYTNEVYQLSDFRKKKNIINVDSISRNKLFLLNAKKFNYKNSKLSTPDKYGFIAQEVEQIFPELVETNGNGDKMVNYIALIPLLIDELQAQRKEINAMKAQLINCCSGFYDNGDKSMRIKNNGNGSANNEIGDNKNQLYQNKPNPFSEQTEIEWNIVEAINSGAYIYVFDLQGKMLYQHPIASVGEGKFSFRKESFEAGMYLYSLYVNGNEIDTKRMIISD